MYAEVPLSPCRIKLGEDQGDIEPRDDCDEKAGVEILSDTSIGDELGLRCNDTEFCDPFCEDLEET